MGSLHVWHVSGKEGDRQNSGRQDRNEKAEQQIRKGAQDMKWETKHQTRQGAQVREQKAEQSGLRSGILLVAGSWLQNSPWCFSCRFSSIVWEFIVWLIKTETFFSYLLWKAYSTFFYYATIFLTPSFSS